LATCVILHERITLYTMKKTTIFLSLLFATSSLYAQIDNTYQAEDDRQRGWYNRPWQRYEAETGKCQTNATILSVSTLNANIQSEATNQVATNLVNKGDYIEWTCGKEANAMTIRFSLPDNATADVAGTGTQGNIGLYVNGQKVNVYQATRESDNIELRNNILLDSYWAWQYFSGSQNVAYETKSGSILRMRYDEIILRTESSIPTNATFKLVKEDDNTNPYTIDFVELEKVEPITYESITGSKIKYEGNGSDIQDFVNNNAGKTIYLPEGKYKVPVRLSIGANTTLQGAGIFYTELFFSAPLDDNNYTKRGLTSSSSNVKVDAMYINGILNQRYYQRNEKKQPGKGLNGSFGSNSIISNVLIQHFECGAWLNGANKLTIEKARIRNNYADGTNIAGGCKNSTIQYCSYRNNGDDDMASWSNSGLAENLKFQYNTSECNWRASGIGIFGGKGHTVDHCLVVDAIEGGLRLDTSYGGSAFYENVYMTFSNISFYNCGTAGNSSVWKTILPTILFNMTKYNNYNRYIRYVKFDNLDLINNKNVAIRVDVNSGNDKEIKNVCFENINIDKATTGLSISYSAHGSINYNNISFENCSSKTISNNAPSNNFTLCNKPCGESCNAEAIFTPNEGDTFAVSTENGNIEVMGADSNSEICIYNALGQLVCTQNADYDGSATFNLNNGAYIVVNKSNRVKITF